MSPELQNYIKQARLMGKNNELITQELSSGGWTPSDISQALNFNPATGVGMGATTSAAVVSGMSGKLVAIIIVTLLVMGAGGYFVYSKNLFSKTPSITSENNTDTLDRVSDSADNTSNQKTFSKLISTPCESFLSLEQAAKIMGVAGAVFKGQTTNTVVDTKGCDFQPDLTPDDLEWKNEIAKRVSLYFNASYGGKAREMIRYDDKDGYSTYQIISGNPDIYIKSSFYDQGANQISTASVEVGTEIGPYGFSCLNSYTNYTLGKKFTEDHKKNMIDATVECAKNVRQNALDNKIIN